MFSNKYIKIKQPMEDTDIIRIAVDLRFASHFESFWGENGSQAAGNGSAVGERSHAHPMGVNDGGSMGGGIGGGIGSGLGG